MIGMSLCTVTKMLNYADTISFGGFLIKFVFSCSSGDLEKLFIVLRKGLRLSIDE